MEVAKRKVSKMVKEVAEERRRRKECEKRCTDEKQDLKEQNELLEFRLLELDAWKQQVIRRAEISIYLPSPYSPRNT